MAPFLTDAQLRAEAARCRACEARPCRSGCPAGLSPADFILAIRCGEPSDYRRAAAHILGQNPLGGTCGQVCPDTLCMSRCARRALDGPVNVPALQAAIVRKARALGVLPRLAAPAATGLRVAVVGAGPAGLGAASVLARAGHAVHVFDRAARAGGMARLVPRERLDPAVLDADVDWVLGLGDVRLLLGAPVPLPRDLLSRGFAAVVVAGGLGEPAELDVPGRERALRWTEVLGDHPPALRGRRVAIVGDGGVALDCAGAAAALGAARVELFALKALPELAPTRRERERLAASGVHVSGRVRVTAIRGRAGRVTALRLHRVELPAGRSFHPSRLVDLPHGEHERRDVDAVVVAIGGRAGLRREPHPRVVYAGDLESGPTSVVEAVASGKRAGLAVQGLLGGGDLAACPDRTSCPGGSGCPRAATCPEWNRPAATDAASTGPRGPPGLPVALDCDVQGQRLPSPFLLAASRFTSAYAPVRRAYEAGWAGAVMAEGAADAIDRLRREFPDRLTLSAAGATLAGDPGSWRGAADLLAGGAQAVTVDALVTRHGLGIVHDLQAGLSWYLAERGLRSVAALVGSGRVGLPAEAPTSAPRPVAEVDPSLCAGCGCCTRCPSLAVALDARGVARVSTDRCTGCGDCVEPCLTGALSMGAR
ncbi:MAG TPA: FAD-dependent oxidoreductase [Anaeromyxobacteraceae bacterium]|nr:FAD-dependent oxidoreductase [Anaeromyxobacteraceae bacterium]